LIWIKAQPERRPYRSPCVAGAAGPDRKSALAAEALTMRNGQRAITKLHRLTVLAASAALSPLAVLAATSAAASETAPDIADSAGFDEIVVVAHKHQRSISDVAANVSVFSGNDFRFELGGSIADLFRYAPGIDYEGAGARFGSESINIRGISGNRVAILVDGVPVSDQFDVGSFANATRDLVSAGFVEHVEVLHGPASALYGSSAIGGVVSMGTVEPGMVNRGRRQGGRLVSNWSDAGNAATLTAIQGLAADPVAMLAGISLGTGSEPDAGAADSNLDLRDFDTRAGLLKFVVEDSAGNSWRASAYHRDADLHSELQSMLGSGRFRSTTALLGDDEYRTDIVSLEYRFAATALADDGAVRVYYQNSDIRQRTYDERGLAARPVAIDRYFAFDQRNLGVEADLQKLLQTGRVSHQIGYGVEARRRDTEEYRDGLETGLNDGLQTNVLLGEVFPLRDFPLSTTTEFGAFLEDTTRIGRWSVIAALRADRYDMEPSVDAMYAEDYPFAHPVSIAESELSPKLGLILHVSPLAEVYLQYAHGFRAPPYADANISLEMPVFNYRAIPNPELRSERSDGLDLGLRWRGALGDAHLSLFRTEYDDFIESKVRIGTDPESGRILFQSQNIDSATIEGIEAGGSLKLDGLSDGLSLEAALFLARGENADTGLPLNSVGPPQGVASINWSPPGDRWRASLRGTFTDDWSDRDESSGALFKPPGYAVFDFFVSRRIATAATLRAGILNLTDRTYWAWTDVRGLAPEDPVIPFLSRPGRYFSVGFDMTW